MSGLAAGQSKRYIQVGATAALLSATRSAGSHMAVAVWAPFQTHGGSIPGSTARWAASTASTSPVSVASRARSDSSSIDAADGSNEPNSAISSRVVPMIVGTGAGSAAAAPYQSTGSTSPSTQGWNGIIPTVANSSPAAAPWAASTASGDRARSPARSPGSRPAARATASDTISARLAVEQQVGGAALHDRPVEQALGRPACRAATARSPAPADSPKTVTLPGSPPNPAMASRTHSRAATWSSRPGLATASGWSTSMKPNAPRR